MVADRGWTLLPYYTFNPNSGLWLHRDGLGKPALSLNDVTYENGTLAYPDNRHRADESALAGYLSEAEAIFEAAEAAHPRGKHVDLGPGFEDLRWFPIPEEV